MKPRKKNALKNIAANMQATENRQSNERFNAIQSIVDSCLNIQNISKRQKAINDIVSRSDEVRQLLADNPELIKSEIEQALYRAATGYTVTETKVKISNGHRITETITKHIPPNQAAIEFYLTNRSGGEYSKNPAVKSDDGEGRLNEILEALRNVK